MKQIEEIRAFFANDRFATENGMAIDQVGESSAVCSLVIQPKHRNAVGGVMGGVPFTLADFAYAVATNHEEPRWVSLSSNITFTGMAKGEKLIATATCVKSGRSTNYYTVCVADELGNKVAEVTVTGFCKG